MIAKEEARIGQKVVWRSTVRALPPTYGIITDVQGERVFIFWDDAEDSTIYVDTPAPFYVAR